MSSLKNQFHAVQGEQDPDIMTALRHWVVQDHQIAATDASVDGFSKMDSDREDLGEYDRVPRIQDLVDPDTRGPSPQSNISRDGISTVDQSTDGAPPRVMTDSESREPAPHDATRMSKLPTARRVLNTLAPVLLVIVLIGITIVLSSTGRIERGGAVLPVSETAQSERASRGADLAPLLQHVETMAHDLATMRQTVEELAAREEVMATNIAMLQASEQNVSRQVTVLTQATAQKSAPQSRRARVRAPLRWPY